MHHRLAENITVVDQSVNEDPNMSIPWRCNPLPIKSNAEQTLIGWLQAIDAESSNRIFFSRGTYGGPLDQWCYWSLNFDNAQGRAMDSCYPIIFGVTSEIIIWKTCGTTLVNHALLQNKFPGRVISRLTDVSWSARSCDLTTFGIFLVELCNFAVCCGVRGRALASHTNVRRFEPQCGGRLSALTCWQL